MARLSRLFIPGCPVVIQLCGGNRQPIFSCKEHYEEFLARVPESALQEGVSVYAFSLQADQATLMLGVTDPAQSGRFVQDLNRHFYARIKSLGRQLDQAAGQAASAAGGGGPGGSSTSALAEPARWEARFKSTVVQPGVRGLKACFFVESQALHAGLVSSLETYPWSSFRIHVGVDHAPWVMDLPSYWQLGNTPFEREIAYRRFADHGLSESDWKEMDQCLQKGWLWSEPAFAEKVESLANRAVRPRPRGRPKKSG